MKIVFKVLYSFKAKIRGRVDSLGTKTALKIVFIIKKIKTSLSGSEEIIIEY